MSRRGQLFPLPSQGLRAASVNAAEVVGHVVQRYRVAMIFQLFAEAIGQARKAPHPHAHREILTLDIARAYMLKVRITADNFHIATDTHRRRIPGLVGSWRAVDFVKLCVVDICTKRYCHNLHLFGGARAIHP